MDAAETKLSQHYSDENQTDPKEIKTTGATVNVEQVTQVANQQDGGCGQTSCHGMAWRIR